MILFQEFKTEDWLAISDAVEPFASTELLKDFFGVVNNGVSMTAVEGGEIMACGGIIIESATKGTVW